MKSLMEIAANVWPDILAFEESGTGARMYLAFSQQGKEALESDPNNPEHTIEHNQSLIIERREVQMLPLYLFNTSK